jgi:integrase
MPHIGALPVHRITPAEVLKVLSPIWIEKPETARRIRQRIATILDWARAAGHRTGDNPVELIGDALPAHRKSEDHHAALPYASVHEFIHALRSGQAEEIGKLAFEFMILTAARSGEIRGALKVEIDCAQKIWTIPGKDAETGRRMKAERDHVVPLSTRCIEILRRAAEISGDSSLLFPGPKTGRAFSENRFLVMRDGLGYARAVCTPHGFRSSFRDWAAEETDFPSNVVEMALAHKIKGKVEAAYRRGNLLAKRRLLMEAWAKYACMRPAPAAKVAA